MLLQVRIHFVCCDCADVDPAIAAAPPPCGQAEQGLLLLAMNRNLAHSGSFVQITALFLDLKDQDRHRQYY